MAAEEKIKSKRFGTRKVKPVVSPEMEQEIAQISARAKAIEDSILKLTNPQIKELSDWIMPRLKAALTSQVRMDTVARILRLRNEYETGVARTEIPFSGAHDYRSNLAASQADGMKARLIGIFSTDPIVKVEGRNKVGVDNQRSVEMFLDYHHDEQARLADKGDPISAFLTVEGHCVLYAPWRLEIETDASQLVEKQIYMKDGETRMVDVNSQAEISSAQQEGFVPKQPLDFETVEIQAPLIKKNYPDLEILSLLDHLTPSNARADTEPHWQAKREYFTLDEIMVLEEEGKFYKGTSKRVMNFLKNKPIEGENKSQSGEDSKEEDKLFEDKALDSVIETWVVWGKAKVPGYKRLQESVLICHPDSDTVFQSKLNTYIGKGNPFFHLRMISVPWRWAGIGVMELSSPGEKAINDLANYVLDEGRIFSALPYIFREKGFAGSISPMDFWKGLKVKDINRDFKELNFRDRRPMDLNVATFIRANNERRVGVGDLQLGRESDVTGKQPPTARGIISILREGQVKFNLINFSVILELMRFAEFEIVLFQQLAGKKTVVDVIGEDGNQLFPDGLSKHQIMGRFKFVPNSSAQNLVRELDAEITLLLYDRLQANPLIAQNLEAFYEMTRDLLHSAGKKKLWLRPLKEYQEQKQKAEQQAAAQQAAQQAAAAPAPAPSPAEAAPSPEGSDIEAIIEGLVRETEGAA